MNTPNYGTEGGFVPREMSDRNSASNFKCEILFIICTHTAGCSNRVTAFGFVKKNFPLHTVVSVHYTCTLPCSVVAPHGEEPSLCPLCCFEPLNLCRAEDKFLPPDINSVFSWNSRGFHQMLFQEVKLVCWGTFSAMDQYALGQFMKDWLEIGFTVF